VEIEFNFRKSNYVSRKSTLVPTEDYNFSTNYIQSELDILIIVHQKVNSYICTTLHVHSPLPSPRGRCVCYICLSGCSLSFFPLAHLGLEQSAIVPPIVLLGGGHLVISTIVVKETV
jgi:hypothetical protein